MTPEQELVQQITELIGNDHQELTPAVEDVAEQYVGVCAEINARLLKCGEFLDKGMRSEAVHEALAPPPLLELIDVINAPEINRWRNFCADYEIALPPKLYLEIVDRLRNEISTEKGLAPLLKKYRRLVHDGDRDGCIGVLREIQVRDPENTIWADNLRPLEEAQLGLLVEDARRALREQNLPKLEEVAAELTDAQRIVRPPKDVMAEISAVLATEHKRQTTDRGEQLVVALNQAMAEDDPAAAGRSLEEWRQLAAESGFEPTSRMRDIVSRVGTWYDAESRREAAEVGFQNALTAMRDVLASPASDGKDFERQWDELMAFGRSVPADLRAQVLQAFERVGQARRKRLLLHSLLGCVFGAIVIGGLVLAVIHVNAVKRRKAAARQLSQLLDQGRYQQAGESLKRIAEYNPRLYQARELSRPRERTRAAIEKQTRAVAGFRAIMDELIAVSKNAYSCSETQISALVQEAGRLAICGPEAQKELESWQLAWKRWLAQKVEAANSGLRPLIVQIQRELDARRAGRKLSSAVERKALMHLQASCTAAETFLPNASSDLQQQFAVLVAELEKWQKQLAAREQALKKTEEKRTRSLHALRGALPNLEQYGELLKQFVKDFPQDPATPSLQRALSEIETYRQTVALSGFSLKQLPPDEDALVGLREMIGSSGRLRGSVWAPDLNTCVEYAASVADVRRKLPLMALDNQDMLSLQVLHYRLKGGQIWKPLYYSKPIRSRREKDANGQICTVYWGEVYYYTTNDSVPWSEHTSKIFTNNLNTTEFEVKIKRQAQDNVVAHARFLRSFLAEAMDVGQLDLHILEGIGTLLEDSEMALVPKAWMIKRLVHLLHDCFAKTIPETAQMVRIADGMKTNVPWMNPFHPQVVEAEQQIQAAVRALPNPQSIVRRLQVNRTLLRKALSRHIRCAGSFQLDEHGNLEAVRALERVTSAWIVVAAAASGCPRFIRVAKSTTGGDLRILESVEPDIFAGQLFFTPADGASEDEVFRSINTLAKDASVKWPHSWPVNARRKTL